MNAVERFRVHLRACPLMAIVRGVRPDEVEAVADAVLGAGIRVIEVPLNSPEPLVSIERLAKHCGGFATVGAGTVLERAEVDRVAGAGGEIIVSPDANADVIEAAVTLGLVSAPGFFTPGEAFGALRAGAHALKLFPAEAAGPNVLKAQLAVIPRHVPVLVVGGVTPENIPEYLAAGASGFGLGSGLYAPGMAAADVAQRAEAYVSALGQARSGQ
jgi:2-dehydro-3-deoxyphosphogalactonate aldolase